MRKSVDMRAPAVVWALRVCWLGLPFTAGDAMGAALDGRSTAVVVVAVVLAWIGWGAGMVASVVPLPVTLTVLRIVAPAAPVVAVAVSTVWAPDAATTFDALLGVLGAALAVIATACALSGATADAYVDGASYGDERRFALRVPVAFMAGPIPVFWSAMIGGVVVGALATAAGVWVLGVGAFVVAAAVARPAVRSFHALSRRWLVFVPAGVTLIDHLSLVDPVLFPARRIARIGPAYDDSTATDYSQAALGLVIEIAFDSPVEVVERTARAEGELRAVSAVLVGPCRPGAVVAEAARRGLRAGVTEPVTD